jgi:hypothetical protein
MFERMEAARKHIFSFDYPTPENIDANTFKDYFETLFISHFIDDYFKYETFERWQIALYSKMLEVLPTYNAKLSNFFYQDKEKLFFNRSTTTTTGNRTNERKNKNISSNFPANLNRAGMNIDNVEYAQNGTLENDINTDENKTETETKTGNSFEMSIKFDEHYKAIFSDLLDEFNGLFSFLIHF